MEEWKYIDGWNGKYIVSNTGRIKSLYRRIGNGKNYTIDKSVKELKPTKNKLGYKMVCLMFNGEKRQCKVHRLVAEAFIPNPENKPFINHIDFNPSNNNVENLEWCTQKENVHHSIERYRIPHNTPSKSGHKFIHKRLSGHYSVWIKSGMPTKTFESLEDAISFRDKILSEMEHIWNSNQ